MFDDEENCEKYFCNAGTLETFNFTCSPCNEAEVSIVAALLIHLPICLSEFSSKHEITLPYRVN